MPRYALLTPAVDPYPPRIIATDVVLAFDFTAADQHDDLEIDCERFLSQVGTCELLI